MISFLVTYRNMRPVLDGFIQSVHMFYPDCEIVVAEQGNNLPFLQGQLFNLAFQYSSGDLVVLMDVDIRFGSYVDFDLHMKELDHPYMGYDRILEWVAEGGPFFRVYPGSDRTHGGCCVLTRNQFIKSCGYSNLLCGWGAEDDILDMRVGGFKRIHNDLYHLRHRRRKSGATYGGNAAAYETEKTRDRWEDGFLQTTASLVTNQKKEGVNHLCFDNIGVVSGFKYASMLRNFKEI